MSEYHVCGVVLMTRPENVLSVTSALKTLPGVELHANDGGRMVLTVEGDAYGTCADTLNQLATLSGVASSSLVYHEIETQSDPEEFLQ